MQLGEIYYGESFVSEFVYYKVTLSVGNRIDIVLTMTQPNMTTTTLPDSLLLLPYSSASFGEISTQGYNLFVGVEYLPTLVTYDYVARSVFAPPHQLVSITINNPLPGDIYIGVYGNVKFEYQVSVHASSTLPIHSLRIDISNPLF